MLKNLCYNNRRLDRNCVVRKIKEIFMKDEAVKAFCVRLDACINKLDMWTEAVEANVSSLSSQNTMSPKNDPAYVAAFVASELCKITNSIANSLAADVRNVLFASAWRMIRTKIPTLPELTDLELSLSVY